jgi:hypothetical protein
MCRLGINILQIKDRFVNRTFEIDLQMLEMVTVSGCELECRIVNEMRVLPIEGPSTLLTEIVKACVKVRLSAMAVNRVSVTLAFLALCM